MPKRLKHPCKHQGCPNLTEDTYCDEHKPLHNNEYNKYCRSEISSGHYGSGWQKIRNSYIRNNPLCERCLKNGRYTPARIVHHILPVTQGGTDEEKNLMSVCFKCHEEIHRHEIGDKAGG